MRRRTRSRSFGQSDVGHSFFGGTGWLFADLMVALAVVFLVATTVGFPTPPKPKPASAHQPAPKKSPDAKQPEPALDLTPVTVTINNLDYNGLLNNSPAALNSVRNAILGDARVRSRRAGLVLLFGGDNPQDDTLALNIDGKVQQILKSLGAQNVLFQVAVYRNFLDLAQPPSNFHMDIYLFKTS
jgi:hypothetical protein